MLSQRKRNPVSHNSRALQALTAAGLYLGVLQFKEQSQLSRDQFTRQWEQTQEMFLAEQGDRKNARVVRAWELLNKTRNSGGNVGQSAALRSLRDTDQDLSGMHLGCLDEDQKLIEKNMCLNLGGIDMGPRNGQDGVRLAGSDFSGAFMAGADLRNANLSFVNLSMAQLRFADLSGAKLIRANLTGVNLRDANLTGVDLSGAVLTDADLGRANLSGAILKDAFLKDATLIQTDVSEAELYSVWRFSAEQLYDACQSPDKDGPILHDGTEWHGKICVRYE